MQHRARFWQALVCYLGPPGHMLWNLKWPLLCVIAVQVGYEM